MNEAAGAPVSGDFLAQMAHGSRERVRLAQARLGSGALRALARQREQPPALRFALRSFNIIAELKLRSPAAGRLGAADEPLEARLLAYASAGAAAASVLTEPTRFDGALEHLELAARALQPRGIPVMRKDFLVDPYQVLEARAAGAGGVLVILRMLAESQVAELIECALELGLFVLLEAFDELDLQRAHSHVARYLRQSAAGGAAAPPALLVGLNCRDLGTLEVVPGRLEQLAVHLPSGVPRVAESGVARQEDCARLAAAGYDGALIGGALMASADPRGALQGLLAAGRRARGGGGP
ncbi:MAG TPA: indole-3-glycerol-phosphate synthase [Steroidobacteraceae bacterium]|nr:indole-3-glycerol-phosphate synthase [Steroidobacteraceae bacterium]